MSTRRRFLVSYDISDPKRLRIIHETMRGYGDWIQYSVFICDLSAAELAEMKGDLLSVMHQDEDKVMIVDTGEAGRPEPFTFLGRTTQMPPDDGPHIV